MAVLRALLLLACVAVVLGQTNLIVQTEYGLLRGVINEYGVRQFLGVPYAAPPINNLRWMVPRQPHQWTGIRNATKYSYACIQPLLQTSVPSAYQSEDCLYLNIYTPNTADGAKLLPVMVWIHGGGFEIGTGAFYDGSHLTNQGNLIIVNFNYRLGPFGFLAQRDLIKTSRGMASLGIQDQQAVLQWVQRNIKAFGGDPNQVTVFGESAGGSSVSLHVTLPSSRGLFKYAIMESGAPAVLESMSYALALGDELTTALGCEGSSDEIAKCLYDADPFKLVGAIPVNPTYVVGQLTWMPAIDGVIIPDTPVRLLADGGQLNADAFVMGTNRNEGVMFTYLYFNSTEINQDQYEGALELTFGSLAEAIIEEYANSTKSKFETFSDIIGDYNFVCPTLLTAVFSSGKVPTFGYMFDYNFDDSSAGVLHAAELPYVFDLPAFIGRPFTTAEQQFSEDIMTMWTSFASSSMPLCPGCRWSEYSPNLDNLLHMQLNNFTQLEGWRMERCRFWFKYFLQ